MEEDDDEEGDHEEEEEAFGVLPGSFMSRTTTSGDPGRGRIRISLVAELDACIEAAQRMATFSQHEWIPET